MIHILNSEPRFELGLSLYLVSLFIIFLSYITSDHSSTLDSWIMFLLQCESPFISTGYVVRPCFLSDTKAFVSYKSFCLWFVGCNAFSMRCGSSSGEILTSGWDFLDQRTFTSPFSTVLTSFSGGQLKSEGGIKYVSTGGPHYWSPGRPLGY